MTDDGIRSAIWNAVLDALLEADSHRFFNSPGWAQETADRITKDAAEAIVRKA